MIFWVNVLVSLYLRTVFLKIPSSSSLLSYKFYFTVSIIALKKSSTVIFFTPPTILKFSRIYPNNAHILFLVTNFPINYSYSFKEVFRFYNNVIFNFYCQHSLFLFLLWSVYFICNMQHLI